MRMRGGAGLGDALYIRAVAEWFVRKGQTVTVATPYPAVFEGAGVQTIPFTRANIDVLAHYSEDRYRQETKQFRDMCLRAGIKEEVPLRFEWQTRNPALVEEMRERAGGRQILLVHGGREPFGRNDGLGLDLIPKADCFKSVLAELRDFFTVGIGDGKRQFYKPDVEMDLVGKTSVTDLLDLGKLCDGIVAQVSFCVPLAECLDKPFLGVWAHKGLCVPTRSPLLKTVTPKKILSKPTSLWVVDDFTEEQIQEGVLAFRGLVGGR